MKIQELVTELRNKTRIDTIYFVACGGSLGGFYPAYYLLKQESKHFRVEMITSNEFVFAPPKACGPNALVVLCTMRGTNETCVAQRIAHERGAITVGLYVNESSLSKEADYPICYKSIADDKAQACEVNSNISLQIAFELLHQFENYTYYFEGMEAFRKLNEVYRKALETVVPMAKAFAETFADSKMMYVMGSGASMGVAYIFSICNIMEMQCIHSSYINNGEFFHGPLEITNESADFFLLKTTGRTRPIDDRAIAFLERYARRHYVLDSMELGIETFGEHVREYFNHSLLSPVLNNVYLRELSIATGKDYLSRNYMWKIPY